MPQAPFIPAALGKPQPRCEKMMELTMDWLMQAGTAKREEGSGGYEKRRNTDGEETSSFFSLFSLSLFLTLPLALFSQTVTVLHSPSFPY